MLFIFGKNCITAKENLIKLPIKKHCHLFRNQDENKENEEYGNTEVILNILLNNPEELNLKGKPSAIRENKIFTLDQRKISISSAQCDDNGHISLKEVSKDIMRTMRTSAELRTKGQMQHGM